MSSYITETQQIWEYVKFKPVTPEDAIGYIGELGIASAEIKINALIKRGQIVQYELDEVMILKAIGPRYMVPKEFQQWLKSKDEQKEITVTSVPTPPTKETKMNETNIYVASIVVRELIASAPWRLLDVHVSSDDVQLVLIYNADAAKSVRVIVNCDSGAPRDMVRVGWLQTVLDLEPMGNWADLLWTNGESYTEKNIQCMIRLAFQEFLK